MTIDTTALCPAHQLFLRIYNMGLDPESEQDPLSEDCAKWLTQLTEGRSVAMFDLDDPFDVDHDLNDFSPLREVILGGKRIWECYRLLQRGSRLALLYVEELAGQPTWARFDFSLE